MPDEHFRCPALAQRVQDLIDRATDSADTVPVDDRIYRFEKAADQGLPLV